MKPLVLVLAAAAALSACGAPKLLKRTLNGGDSPQAEAAAVEPGAPKATPGFDWRTNTDGDRALLAYGDGAGDAKLILTCIRGTGQVSVWRPTADTAPQAPVTLQSGTARGTYLAIAQASPIAAEGRTFAFNASMLDPVLIGFWKHGWIQVVDGDTTTSLSPQPGTTVVKPFAAFCAEARPAKAG